MTKRKAPPSSELVVASPRETGPTRMLEPSGTVAVPEPVTAGPMTVGPTHDIQTTFRPDQTITVSDAEYQDLLARGLVYSGSPQAPAADFYDTLLADKVQHGTATPSALRAAFDALPPSLLGQLYTGISSATTPAGLPGLALWLKADTLALSDGAAVASWADSSGNGRTFTQGTSGAQPIFRTGVLGAKPVVRFASASSQYLHGSYGGEPGTIVVVGKQNTAGAYAALCGAKGAEGFTEAWSLRAQRGDHWQAEFARDDRRNSTSPSSGDVTQYLAAQNPIPVGQFNLYMGTLDVGTRTLAFYMPDGYAQRVRTTWSLGPADGNMVVGAGYSYHAPGEFLNGDIAEVIIYDRALSDAELDIVGRYLAAKYGLTYTAVQRPPALDVPLLLSSFNYDPRNRSNTLYLLGSSDGYTFRGITGTAPVYTNPVGEAKDCSVRYNRADRCFYIVHSDAVNGGTTFGLVRYDPVEHVATRLGGISMAALAGVTQVWAPEWFEDFDGTLYVLFAGSTDNGATFRCYATQPDATLSTWSTPVNVSGGTGGGTPIDFFMLRFGSTYYLWYKGAAYPEVMTAPALTGPYTPDHTGNWGGWSAPSGSGYEGPSLVNVNGSWLLYTDDGHLKVSATQNALADSGPFTDFQQVVVQPSGLPVMNHGTVIRL